MPFSFKLISSTIARLYGGSEVELDSVSRSAAAETGTAIPAEANDLYGFLPALSRRQFLQTLAASAAIGGFASAGAQANGLLPSASTPQRNPAVDAQRFSLNINGRQHSVNLEPHVTLLDALREHLGMTGTKKGCDHGQCGACTVLVNGRRINSCLTLAIMHAGDKITTIEGLGQPDQLGPMQAAFVEHDAFQCGYCTPGQICSATALLGEMAAGTASVVTPDLTSLQPIAFTDSEIRERMSGNLCRCGAYPNIVAAIREVHENDGQSAMRKSA